jgi:hypothetical protein
MVIECQVYIIKKDKENKLYISDLSDEIDMMVVYVKDLH